MWLILVNKYNNLESICLHFVIFLNLHDYKIFAFLKQRTLGCHRSIRGAVIAIMPVTALSLKEIFMNRQQSEITLHRFYSCLPYLLPMSAGVIYGAVLFQQFPLVALPFFPFIWLYANVLSYPLVPFLGLTGEFFLFIGLYFLLVKDSRVPHFIRFNTMQALLMQIALFIAQLFFQLIEQLSSNALPSIISSTIANTIFIGTMLLAGYAIYQSIKGEYSDIPTLSQAASVQCDL